MAKLFVKEPEKLKALIALKGDTLKTFSKEVDVSNQYLSLVIRGKSNPSPALAKRISEKLNTSIEHIFFIDSV